MLDQSGSLPTLPAYLLPRSLDQIPHTLWYMDQHCFLYFMFHCRSYNVRTQARTDLAGVDFHSAVQRHPNIQLASGSLGTRQRFVLTHLTNAGHLAPANAIEKKDRRLRDLRHRVSVSSTTCG